MPVILTESDVRAVLSMDDLIAAMEQALVRFSAREVQQPLRTVLEVGPQRAFFGLMPAYLPGAGALGAKLVTVYASNVAAGLPTHLATILLLDHETGGVQAIIDGRYITEARTAAVSALSARLLARPEASTLALIGSGVQARSHLEAIWRVRRLREIRVWSRSEAHRVKFAREMQAHAAPVTASSSAQEAVRGADIVVLATSSRVPVVENGWIDAGTHICAVGACRPDQREMDTALVGRARVFVDSREGAAAEAGDLVLPMQEGAFDVTHIAGEIGELAAGRVPGRRSADEITIFKSLGMAVEDIAAAHLAYMRASERGLGRGVVL